MGDQAGKGDLTSPEMINSLERRKATVIKNEIEQVLKKVQKEYKTDIFGFAKVLKENYPDIWEKIEDDWKTIFPEIEVKIEVETKIKYFFANNGVFLSGSCRASPVVKFERS